jgi:uncharacterized membrane protein YsdA (DUF1294 family)
MWTVIAIVAYVVLNIVTFIVYRLDKKRAERERQRLPEWHLLLLAFIGGALGAVLAQQIFRHKTKKQPFRALLICAVIINIAVAAWVLSPEVRAYIIGLVFGR